MFRASSAHLQEDIVVCPCLTLILRSKLQRMKEYFVAQKLMKLSTSLTNADPASYR